MKQLSFVLISLIAFIIAACGDDSNSSEVSQNEVDGILTDSRNGLSYKTVTIGSQMWMAQNLNYETANSYCYDDNASNCTKYGRLYTWDAAKTACPSGWHLPTKAEFETLFTTVGGQSTGTKLKATSGWSDLGGYGTDDYSFSALPAGSKDYKYGGYSMLDHSAYFWSSTEYNWADAYAVSIGKLMELEDDDANLFKSPKGLGSSVRCVKD